MDALIAILGFLTYGSAVYQMLKDEYSPSVFSRAIWFLLGINSFAGVALGGGSASSKLLALTLLIGNGAVFLISIRKGSRAFGSVEITSLMLFALSCVIWLVFDAPFINLIISLVAHFIGGVPTMVRTLRDPSTEKALHWYFFFVASILAIFNSSDRSLDSVLFPVYFAAFDGLIILLVNRRLFMNSQK